MQSPRGTMPRRPLLIVVLAAGQGTRMKSALPKVLHKIAGRAMLGHVLAAAEAVRPDTISVVIAPGMDAVRTQVLGQAASARIFVQAEQKGTADALLAARDALETHKGDVLVLYADTPLLTPETLTRL